MANQSTTSPSWFRQPGPATSVLLFFAAGYYSKMEASAFLLFEAGWLWRSKIMYE